MWRIFSCCQILAHILNSITIDKFSLFILSIRIRRMTSLNCNKWHFGPKSNVASAQSMHSNAFIWMSEHSNSQFVQCVRAFIRNGVQFTLFVFERQLTKIDSCAVCTRITLVVAKNKSRPERHEQKPVPIWILAELLIFF